MEQGPVASIVNPSRPIDINNDNIILLNLVRWICDEINHNIGTKSLAYVYCSIGNQWLSADCFGWMTGGTPQ